MSYTNLICHIVIRPKSSQRVIAEAYEKKLYAYILGFSNNKHCRLYRIGGMPDHVHILIEMAPDICVSDFVKDLKTSTNAFMRKNKDMFPLFEGWASEYFAASCSPSDVEGVRQYIIGQKEHHKSVSFIDELKQVMRECGVDFEENFLNKW